MRRRILMAALWLAGTFGATAVVFAAVGKLSTNLSSIGDDTRRAPRLGPGATGTTTTAEPFITTTSSSTTTVDPTTSTTSAETTTTSSEVEAPTDATDAPPATPAPPVGSPTVTRTTVVAVPTVPVVVTTATTVPPTLPPTVPPSTSPPVVTTVPVTSPPEACKTGRKFFAGRNTVLYQVCSNGVSLTQAQPAPGWSVQQPVVLGPPVVSVTFTNGSTTATCTLRSAGEGNVDTNDC